MVSSGMYKMDNGKPCLNNCFPAKSLLRLPEEGRGHWIVSRKGSMKKGVAKVSTEGQENQKKVSFDTGLKKISRKDNQADVLGHVLDRCFLLKHHSARKPSDLCTINVSGMKFSKAKEKDFKHFTSVIYINASENLLPLDVFHTFPTLKELELAFNGIKMVYVKYGDFKTLEFLDLSFNSLTEEAICDLGILPHLRVLLLTGNGLTSLPPNMAVKEQEASVTSLTSKKYILRFPALETLMLDDNKLSNPSCFASLAGLRRLKKLSLDQNKIFRIPYLQQVQLREGTGDWVTEGPNPQKELQPQMWIFETPDEQPNYTVLPMKKDVDRTEVVFSSYPGFSTSETAKIAKEDAVLPAALFPSLCELVFHNNPLVAHTRGVPPLLKSFLQDRLGIRLVRKKLVKPKHHILMPRKESRKVKTYIPKVPKQSLVPHHLKTITDNPPSSLRPEPEHSTEDTSHEALFSNEGPEGPSITHRAFVPMPPICSDSTVHSETVSHQSHTAGLMGSEHLSDDDAKSTESIFLTQVNELPSSTAYREKLETEKNDQRRPSTAPRETKRTRRKQTATSLHKYDGYEELLTVKPDPAFLEPKGIQKNAQALHRMLKQPLICRSSKPRLDSFQKPYVPKEKRAGRMQIPTPRKTRAQLLDDILIRMRDPRNVTEAPLGTVLQRRAQQRLVNQKQYREAKRLLKEFRARYRQLVRSSLRTVFAASPPPRPPTRRALSAGQPKLGRFLEFMDEFCQEPTASDSKE
ncbi:X-ray radiation resistance-associated protein 1 isoform X2 [Mastomys coucha]|uniref:X-ray radiation resistance-associated protein 1 isoform X2 n=1 Tax=Mastomys coucha TaxID=35658 RepID=UPI001261D46E|nr:X-ray radiation resistance-associated protein 1 isoform X2 [Mastomys coucha]